MLSPASPARPAQPASALAVPCVLQQQSLRGDQGHGLHVLATCGTLSAAAVVGFAEGRRSQAARGSNRIQRRQAAVTAPEVQVSSAPELGRAWKKALEGRGEAWQTLLDAPGDETIGPVRFEKIGDATAPDDGAADTMLFLPDLDFSGVFAAPQFPGLAAAGFELWRCFLPEGDKRTVFAQLQSAVQAWVQKQGKRQVILMGEGFGALLALAVTLRLGRQVKGLVLVNPPSLDTQPLAALGRSSALLEQLQELLTGPLAGAASAPGASLGTAPLAARAALSSIGARAAAAAAASGCLGWRLRAWLRDGCEVLDDELSLPSEAASLPPVLVLSSKEGPALEAAQALEPKLKERCSPGRFQLKTLDESAGREPLADARLELPGLIRDSCIYQRPKDRVLDFKFPTLDAVESGSASVERLAGVVSPVFCSFDSSPSCPSQRQFGLKGVPTPADLGGRPVLLVGNHQIMGLDLGPLVREFILDRGVVARGLANSDAMRSMEGRNGGADTLFTTFGAVTVTPRNIFKLLQKGEMVLLFPGGMREALHGPGEEYQVMWPEQTEFVRVAARFNAVVVPFGGIGADDSLQVVGDSREFRKNVRNFLPFLPEQEEKKRDTNVLEVAPPRPSPPLLAPALGLADQTSPGLGDRYYYSFGEPLDLKDVNPKDSEACAQAYETLRTAVQRELSWLLQARQQDPYRGLLRRQLYERGAAVGAEPRKVAEGPLQGKVVESYGPRAPSFPLEKLAPP